MGTYILSIDQGTTGTTVMVMDFTDHMSPKILSKTTVDFKQYYPKPGWVEHDLVDIWESVVTASKKSLELAAAADPQFSLSKIKSLGITNQRETLCVYDRKTLEPSAKAIVWQCRRTADMCSDLKKRGFEGMFKEKTGLVLDPYFSGTKLAWLLDQSPELMSQFRDGQLCVGTVDTFLLSKLSGGESYKTEPSNASRTLMYDIHSGGWDESLLEALGIPSSSRLAEVVDSSSEFGTTKGLDFLPDGVLISGILGDQQAALLGQACFYEGQAKCTYGTGAFLLVNTGERVVASEHGLLSTVAWQFKGCRTYALEGSCFIAGAGVQFIRDQLSFIEKSEDSENLAAGQHAAPDLYFVPALAGLGAPYWNPHARGAFLGLTRGTSKQELILATLEGIGFSVFDLIEAMKADLGSPISLLRVDGGACANNLLMQFQADLCSLTIDRPKHVETTAFGAALASALGSGIYRDLSDVESARACEQTFNPGMSDETKASVLGGWSRAVKAVQVFSGA